MCCSDFILMFIPKWSFPTKFIYQIDRKPVAWTVLKLQQWLSLKIKRDLTWRNNVLFRLLKWFLYQHDRFRLKLINYCASKTLGCRMLLIHYLLFVYCVYIFSIMYCFTFCHAEPLNGLLYYMCFVYLNPV